MLNRTTRRPPPPPPQDPDLDAEDRRIEVAAARETALALSIRNGINARNDFDIVATAIDFESFLLANQANGQAALEVALKVWANRAEQSNAETVLKTAQDFCDYLAGTTHPATPAKPVHHAV